MNNRFLPIKIANKELSVNLSIDPKTWYDPAFVVVNGDKKLLLTIKEKAAIIPPQKNIGKLNPRGLDEKLSTINGIPVWDVVIGLGDTSEDEKGGFGKHFTATVNNTRKEGLQLNFTGNSIRTLQDWGAIHVHFKYKETKEEEIRLGSCFIIVGKKEDKFGNLNIDLGSEATQMAYLPIEKNAPGISPVATNISIIKEIKKGYSKLHVGDDKTEYIQRDKTDKDLYKTGKIIYKRKGNLAQSYDDPSSVLALLSDRAFLDPTQIANYNKANNAMLWDWKTYQRDYTGTANVTDEKETYIEKIQDNLTMIGNLKLAYLDPNSGSIGIELENLDSMSSTQSEDNLVELISYIYQILIGIGTREMKKGKDALFMRLLLLMPNVYHQDRVNMILRILNEKFNKKFIEHYFFQKNEQALTEIPIVIESFAISESDASLIGFLRNNTLRVNKKREDVALNDRFLIIDAGRGTIDYSILEFLGEEDYSCIDRGGMAGAGQYLTNIFLKAVGSLFTKKYGHPEKYISFLGKLDMLQTLVLEDFFERLKANYSIEYTKDIEEEDFFAQFLKHIYKDDVRLAIEALQNSFDTLDPENGWIFTLERPKEFIEAQSQDLVTALVENLAEANKDNIIPNIKYVVLSGRGMKFKLFQSQLQAALKAKVKYKPKRDWWNRIKGYDSVVFPDPMDSKALKKKAVNLKRITNFSVNANSNLLITFDNESESNSLFSGVDIRAEQLRRFNYRYKVDRSQSNAPKGDEIDQIFYLGMQSDYAFLLGSDAGRFYPAIAERNYDFRSFLSDTLFGPGQKMENNSEMYERFISEITYLGLADSVPIEEATKKDLIDPETSELTEKDEEPIEETVNTVEELVTPSSVAIIDVLEDKDEKDGEESAATDTNAAQEDEKNDKEKDNKKDNDNNDKKSSSDLLGD